MKITHVEGFILHVPVTEGRIADSSHDLTHWGAPGVAVHTDEGLVGYGYTGTHAHLGYDRVIRDIAVEIFGSKLLGRDPANVLAHWERLATDSATIWVGRSGLTKLAHAALDIALWDLKAKAAQVPLWELLGGGQEKRIAAYDTDGGWLNRTPEAVAQSARASVDERGFRAVKLKVGSDDLHADLARVEAVRTVLGPRAQIMVDANGRYTLPQARWMSRQLAAFDVAWFEEPIWYDDIGNTAFLRETEPTPIALGEQLDSIDQFREMILARAVDYVQPDAVRLAGITEWWRVADLAASHRLPVVSHVGDMMQVHLQLATAHASTDLLEYIPWLRECFDEPATVTDGLFEVPQRPGAGTTLRDDALERFGVQ
jgi:L-alanine-DL-glutamate epimerase-like enolase superfamily enzyme